MLGHQKLARCSNRKFSLSANLYWLSNTDTDGQSVTDVTAVLLRSVTQFWNLNCGDD